MDAARWPRGQFLKVFSESRGSRRDRHGQRLPRREVEQHYRNDSRPARQPEPVHSGSRWNGVVLRRDGGHEGRRGRDRDSGWGGHARYERSRHGNGHGGGYDAGHDRYDDRHDRHRYERDRERERHGYGLERWRDANRRRSRTPHRRRSYSRRRDSQERERLPPEAAGAPVQYRISRQPRPSKWSTNGRRSPPRSRVAANHFAPRRANLGMSRHVNGSRTGARRKRSQSVSSSRSRVAANHFAPRRANLGMSRHVNGSRTGARRKRSQSASSSAASSASSHDDTVGAYKGITGDAIDDRYEIVAEAGLGTFGRVVKCLRREDGTQWAVKVVRSVKRYGESAIVEAEILLKIKQKASAQVAPPSHCVMIEEWFMWHGHACLVFEPLGPSLYDYLKGNHYVPFSLGFIRRCARQLLECMHFLHHECNLVHTDLKLENILLVDDASESLDAPDSPWRSSPQRLRETSKKGLLAPHCANIRVIDFGGATYDNDKRKSSVVNTRQYRSPEVILGLGWSYPSDIWSVGCILMELFTGDLLFQTHDNAEHLALMERILGAFPPRVAEAAARKAPDYFHRDGRLRYPTSNTSSRSREQVKRTPPLRELVTRMPGGDDRHKNRREGSEALPSSSRTQSYAQLLELVEGLLQIHSAERWSAAHALAHPFVEVEEDEGAD